MIEKYLDNRLVTLYFLPLILGSLTVFSYQPFNLTVINFLILPVLFFLIIYIKKKSKSFYRKKPYKKNLFIFGTIFGFSFFLSGTHWISYSLTFDESFKILIPFGLILIPLFLSLFFSLMILAIGSYLNYNLPSILLFSGCLAFSDYLRSKILTGFPWNLWAYSFSWATEIIQILNLLGLFAFNLIIITIFMIPAIFFFKRGLSFKFSSFFFILLIFFALYIYGNHSINKNQKTLKSLNESFNIKIISPNFNLEYGLNEAKVISRLDKLIKYSQPENDTKTLYVWPEGVFSGYSFNDISVFKNKILNSFKKNHFIIFGINRFDQDNDGYYNSLIIVNNQLEILKEYRKQKLVPFGELLPFEKILKKMGLKKITEGHGSFLKGKKQENLKFEKLNILPLICYEIIFTEMVQNSHQDTNLVVNISEDGWFGNSIGPYQ